MFVPAICVIGKIPYENIINLADALKCQAFVSLNGEDEVMFSESKDFKTEEIAAQIKIMYPALAVRYIPKTTEYTAMWLHQAEEIMANLPKTNGG